MGRVPGDCDGVAFLLPAAVASHVIARMRCPRQCCPSTRSSTYSWRVSPTSAPGAALSAVRLVEAWPAAHAKEGMIKQRTCARAMEKLAAALGLTEQNPERVEAQPVRETDSMCKVYRTADVSPCGGVVAFLFVA